MEPWKLFTSIKVGGIETKNRIVFSPIECNFATEDGFVSNKNLRHYEERARGGTGIIIVEATSINKAPFAGVKIKIYKDKFIPGLTKLSTCIKKQGAKAFIQLVHPGPKAGAKETAVSASEIPIRDFSPREL